jgi:hypothetical protein
MIVVLVQLHGFESHLREQRFDPRWELALVVPVFCIFVSFDLTRAATGEYIPLEIAIFSSSIACCSSGWKSCYQVSMSVVEFLHHVERTCSLYSLHVVFCRSLRRLCTAYASDPVLHPRRQTRERWESPWYPLSLEQLDDSALLLLRLPWRMGRVSSIWVSWVSCHGI